MISLPRNIIVCAVAVLFETDLSLTSTILGWLLLSI
jgi:hypothetical protein